LLIYPSGKYIIVKNYLNPSECFVYRGHAQPTTVAKFSPNGFWVASADTSGKVRIWSWDNPEHLTKLECPVFAGAVYDLDWDNESKKITAVGDGSGILVKCFQWDTGSAAGEMLGHNKRVLSVAYKPSRPFRVMSGGEDMRCLFFAGPPFKLDHSNNTHTNFVNCVRYSSTGGKVVSVGSDKKIQLYDGATGEPAGEILNAHEGGIYSVSFSPDGSHFATASADKTIKIWQTDSLTNVQTLSLSSDPQIADAQVSVLWTRDYIISVSLNGNINLFPTTIGVSVVGPERIIHAHQVSITAMANDVANQSLYTGSYDGVVCVRTLRDNFDCQKVKGTDKKNISGAAHGGKCVGLAVLPESDLVVSVGWDDRIRWASRSSGQYHSDQALNGQPVALVAAGSGSNLVLVITNQELAFFRGTDKVSSHPLSSLPYSPTCAAMLGEEEIAIGGSDNKTHIYSFSSADSKLGSEVRVIETRSPVSAVAYSPDHALLAIGDTGRQVEVYERGTWATRIKGKWVFHTSKVTCLAWSPDGKHLATGSLDENIFIWSLEKPMSKHQFTFSHSGGVTGVDWLAADKLVSVGNDHTIVTWDVAAL
jgi:WD40 repeat protein